MNPSHDHRSSSLMGYSMKGGYPDGQGAPPPAPLPPLPPQGYLLPYQGGPVYAASYPPPTAYPADYSFQSCNGMGYSSNKYGLFIDEPTNSHKFARLVFATMVTLIISLSMTSLVIWLMLGVDVSDFQVASFSVSNLVISASVVQATWTANITVTNPNTELKVASDSFKASILYKDYPLAMAAIKPTLTQALNSELNKVNLFFKMENETSISRGDLAEEVMEAEKARVLVVSLRLASGSKSVSNNGWAQDTIRIFCEDLKIFISRNGEGQLAEESPRGCLGF